MTLHTQRLKTLAQVQAFVSSNEALSFTLTDRTAAYGWMTDTLKQFHYARCTRADKGVLRQYLGKVRPASRVRKWHAVLGSSPMAALSGIGDIHRLCRGTYQRSLSAAGARRHDGCVSVCDS